MIHIKVKYVYIYLLYVFFINNWIFSPTFQNCKFLVIWLIPYLQLYCRPLLLRVLHSFYHSIKIFHKLMSFQRIAIFCYHLRPSVAVVIHWTTIFCVETAIRKEYKSWLQPKCIFDEKWIKHFSRLWT